MIRQRQEDHGLPLLVLDLRLDVVDGVRGLDLKSDCFAGEGLYENLHVGSRMSGVKVKDGVDNAATGRSYIENRSLNLMNQP
jgi:hypothetical protein